MNDERATNKGFSEAAELPVAEEAFWIAAIDRVPVAERVEWVTDMVTRYKAIRAMRGDDCATEPALKRATPEVGPSGAASELVQHLRDRAEYLGDATDNLSSDGGLMWAAASRLVSVEQERDRLKATSGDGPRPSVAEIVTRLRFERGLVHASETEGTGNAERIVGCLPGCPGCRQERLFSDAADALAVLEQRADGMTRQWHRALDGQVAESKTRKAAEARVADLEAGLREIADGNKLHRTGLWVNPAGREAARRLLAGVPQDKQDGQEIGSDRRSLVAEVDQP